MSHQTLIAMKKNQWGRRGSNNSKGWERGERLERWEQEKQVFVGLGWKRGESYFLNPRGVREGDWMKIIIIIKEIKMIILNKIEHI